MLTASPLASKSASGTVPLLDRPVPQQCRWRAYISEFIRIWGIGDRTHVLSMNRSGSSTHAGTGCPCSRATCSTVAASASWAWDSNPAMHACQPLRRSTGASAGPFQVGDAGAAGSRPPGGPQEGGGVAGDAAGRLLPDADATVLGQHRLPPCGVRSRTACGRDSPADVGPAGVSTWVVGTDGDVRLRQHETLALGLRYGITEFPRRVNPEPHSLIDVAQCSLLRVPVGHASGQFRHFGDECPVGIAPIENDLVLVVHSFTSSPYLRITRRTCRT